MWSSRWVARGSRGLAHIPPTAAAPAPAWSCAPQAKSERNYHIFYEMLAGLPAHQRQRYCLQGAETYYYLNQVACPLPDSLALSAFWGAGQAQGAGGFLSPLGFGMRMGGGARGRVSSPTSGCPPLGPADGTEGAMPGWEL